MKGTWDLSVLLLWFVKLQLCQSPKAVFLQEATAPIVAGSERVSESEVCEGGAKPGVSTRPINTASSYLSTSPLPHQCILLSSGVPRLSEWGLSSFGKNQMFPLVTAPLLLRLISASGFIGLPTEVSAQPQSHDQLLQPSVGSPEQDR